jgi:hypothetical protein
MSIEAMSARGIVFPYEGATDLVVNYIDGTQERFEGATEMEGHIDGVVEVKNSKGHVIGVLQGRLFKSSHWEARDGNQKVEGKR